MNRRRQNWIRFSLVQVVVVVVIIIAFVQLGTSESSRMSSKLTRRTFVPTVPVPRKTPLRIEPLHDDPEVVSEEELAAVLKKIRPRFDFRQLSPNYVEHALRAWGIAAEFQDSEVMQGHEMLDFLVDHGKYLDSWGPQVMPLLEERDEGVAIRWGGRGKEAEGSSVHHDHLIACLTEAGVSLDEPVFIQSRRNMTINNVLQEAMRDFHLDEREVEWSVMAFGLWLAPHNKWETADSRKLNFDLLAKRLMRGDQRFGVCSGTHRVYSLMLLWRLNDEQRVNGKSVFLSDKIRDAVYAHLKSVRDRIKVCQFPDGHWPSDWSRGAEALSNPRDDIEYRQVIATGHHLEWLAIAPKELHPPHDQIVKAADWIIKNTTSTPDDVIAGRYTFYSHVGNALALWRHTHPADFWKEWRKTHPYVKPKPKPKQPGDNKLPPAPALPPAPTP